MQTSNTHYSDLYKPSSESYNDRQRTAKHCKTLQIHKKLITTDSASAALIGIANLGMQVKQTPGKPGAHASSPGPSADRQCSHILLVRKLNKAEFKNSKKNKTK